MIGMCEVATRAQDRAHLGAAQDRQIEVENDQVGRGVRHNAECPVAARDDIHGRIAEAFEPMLDEQRDIVLVLDEEDAREMTHRRGHPNRRCSVLVTRRLTSRNVRLDRV